MIFCKSAKTPWVFWWRKSKCFLKKTLEILRFQWGRKAFWCGPSDNSAERCFRVTDVQGIAPDSEEQITIYDIPSCLSIWTSLVAAPGLCPQWKYREPVEESVLFSPTLIPSKEAQGKGGWKKQLLVPLWIQPKPVEWSMQGYKANSDLIKCSGILLVETGPGRRAEPYGYTHQFLGNADKQRRSRYVYSRMTR